MASDDGLERALDAGATLVVTSASATLKETGAEVGLRAVGQVARTVACGALPVVSGVDDSARRVALEAAGATVLMVDAPIVLPGDKAEAVSAWRAGGTQPTD